MRKTATITKDNYDPALAAAAAPPEQGIDVTDEQAIAYRQANKGGNSSIAFAETGGVMLLDDDPKWEDRRNPKHKLLGRTFFDDDGTWLYAEEATFYSDLGWQSAPERIRAAVENALKPSLIGFDNKLGLTFSKWPKFDPQKSRVQVIVRVVENDGVQDGS